MLAGPDTPTPLVQRMAAGVREALKAVCANHRGAASGAPARAHVQLEKPSPTRPGVNPLRNREVRISRPFEMSRHEITVGQFRAFVQRSGYVPESVADGTGGHGYNPAYDPASSPRGDAFEGRLPRYS